jgi:hypothetical protein
LITGVDVGEGCRERNDRRTGDRLPTSHVLNMTASAIESLTMSWWFKY